MNFGFMIPRISIRLSALKDDPQCSYDLGLFKKLNKEDKPGNKADNPFSDPSFNRDDEQSWNCLLQLDRIIVGVTKSGSDLDVQMELQSLMIEDRINPRFPHIVSSKTGAQDITLIKIDVKKKDRTSPTYSDTEMDVNIIFGQLYVNWHPKSLNRLIRFLRFMKFEKTVIQQETEKFYEQNKKKLAHQVSGLRSPRGNFSDHAEQIVSEEKSNCVTNPNKPMVVKVSLDLLQITLIHPINHTYPIATMRLGGFGMDYISAYDHDQFCGSIKDMRMIDNTNYPLTINPDKIYTGAHQYPAYELFGPRVESQPEDLLAFDCVMFHKPLDNECIHQLETFDKNIKLHFGSIKFRFINEWILRLNDYFFNQLLGAVSDGNPFQPTIDKLLERLNQRLKEEQLKQVELFQDDYSNVAIKAPKFTHVHSSNTATHLRSAQTMHEGGQMKLTASHNSHKHHDAHRHNSLRVQAQREHERPRDLNQQKSCPNIQLSMDNLLLVIKDRPYLPNELHIDLGQMNISSVTKEVTDRYSKHEFARLWVTQFLINMKSMSFCFNESFYIAQKFDLNITFEKPNYTPLIQDAFLAKDIDFTDLDWSYRIHVNFSPLIMHLKQDAYQFLLRCNDLNFNYTDGLTRYFQLAIWNIPGEDSLKYIKNEEEIVRIHKNKEVYKMKVYLHFPSMALQVHNNKSGKFLTEMVLWNAKVDFLKYVDYRKSVVLSSHTFFILHSPQHRSDQDQLKQIAIAPVNSLNFITTDHEFYNFEVEKRVKNLSPTKKAKALQKYSKHNFVINMHMEPDGEKLIQVKIEKLKIFIKPHIYLMIFELFVYGMPQYAMDSRDKPNYYDSDWGNAAKMEVGCSITQSLLCFENDPKFDKTIACQGNTSFTYIREKMNQIKRKLVEQPSFVSAFSEQPRLGDDGRRTSMMAPFPTVDSSSTFKIMQVSISDLCPFFCHPNDLDGKNFKQVRKREMMSPFTLFFNKQDIIELQKSNERGAFGSIHDKLLFKVFNKVEANLERTLLKISFNDIKLLKGIADHLYFMLNQEYMNLTQSQPEEEAKEITLRVNKNRFVQREKTAQVMLESGRGHSLLVSKTEKKEHRERHSERLRIPINREKTLKPDGDLSEGTGGHASDEDSLRTESNHESQSDEEEQDDYFDDEEQLKFNMKVEKNKELAASLKRNSPQGKYGNKINNLTESLRRASNAFSMFQESYFQRNKARQTEQAQGTDMEKQYELIHQIHSVQKLYPSPEQHREEEKVAGNFVIREEDEDEDEDVDEGDRVIFTQSSLDIVKGLSPDVSKGLLSVSDMDIPANIEIAQIKEEKGVNQFQIVSYGLKILIINDSGQNFFPVLGLSLSEFHFSSDQNETQKAGQTQFSSAINYYNAEAGEWEPFIETFNVHITLMEEYITQKKIIQVEIPSSIGINMTLRLVQNISETFKSWEQSELEEESFAGSSREQSKSSIKPRPFGLKDTSSSNPLEEDSQMLADRGGTQRMRTSSQLNSQGQRKSVQSRYLFDDLERDDDAENGDREEEDVVTPYSICNHTNVKLLIKRLNPNSDGNDGRRFHEGSGQRKTEKAGHDVYQKARQTHSKLNRVYVIKPDQKIDYAVDYELQVKQQMNMYSSHQFSGQQGEFIKILFNENAGERGSVMNIPLNSVNLNQIGYKKHFVREDDPVNRTSQENEFYLYGVQQINMKKVLTIRTQYLFVNQTFFCYDIHIRFSNSSIVRTLGPGDKLPIPNSYNKHKFQIRISPLKERAATQDKPLTTDQDNLAAVGSNTTRQRRINESSLIELLKSGRDIPNFQTISKNWSDLLPIESLKSRLPVNRATFLKHGRTFSIIKKEPSCFPEGFDIVLRPPLLLKNCLPVPILIEYQDSNDEFDRLDLQKQEEKHIFAFNLQQSVMMKVIIEGFQPAVVVLECSSYDKEVEIKTTVYDFSNRPLDVYVHTSSKVAGRKAVFYVKNLVINNTEENLNFYYDSPSERQIKSKSSKEAVAGGPATLEIAHKRGEYFMLSDKHEIYAHIEGSLEVSNPINIFNPGCKDRFMLSMGSKLFEYSYSTEIFLATKDDYVYTKITTISPQYVIVNQTSFPLGISQVGDDASEHQVIEAGQRIAFHWAHKDKEKQICVRLESEIELEWTYGIPIHEVGSISIRNRQKMPPGWRLHELDRRRYHSQFLRVERKYFKNTLFVLVEEENLGQPFYRIENHSKTFSLRYFQQAFSHHADFLNINQQAPFAWSNILGEHRLEVELFFGDLDEDGTFKVPLESENGALSFSLDQLNYREAIQIPLGGDAGLAAHLHVWTFTDGFTKVIRFSDTESKRIDEDKLSVAKDENVQSLQMIDIYMKSINLSVVGSGVELFTLYLQGLVSKLMETEVDRKVEFKIGYLQLDNQSESDPIFPVIVKPKYVKPDPTINNHGTDPVEEDTSSGSSVRYQGRTNPSQFAYKNGVFELYVELRKDIPNVLYFEQIQHQTQSFELKLEFSHILQISKFLSTVGGLLNKNLTFMHQIFDNDQSPTSPSESQDDEVSPGRRRENRLGDTFSAQAHHATPQKQRKSIKTGQPGLMAEKKLFFGLSQNQASEQKQQTIASSLNLVRNASVKEKAFQLESSKLPGAEGEATALHRTSTQVVGGSPKRQDSLQKQKSQHRRQIIEKMRLQDNLRIEQEVRVHRDNWKEEEFKQQVNRIYIKRYDAGPIEVEVSVMNKANYEVDDNSDIIKTISSLGLLISSIDQAPIQLNALGVENIFGNQADVIDQLKNHHTSQLSWNLLKLIGASNLLGNPMNFVNALGTGVQDFFYEPKQGFTRGTIQGGIGIIKGTTSLVTNTFVGAIGSASKMAQSVSKGLLVLSNDKDYIYRRDVENIKKRPKNVLQGLQLGLNQAIGSIGSGIVGVVAQPIEETKKGGLLGFFKGTVKGVAGLVVKPISGTLDLFSSTTEGIKNTSKKLEELQQDKRLRLPRPFYETEHIIREYDEFHAFWVNSIPRIAPQLSTRYFYDAILIESTELSWSVLILTQDHLALIHTELAPELPQNPKRQQKPPISIKWVINTKEIRYVELIDDRLLSIGFETGSNNLPLSEAYVTEKIKFKIEKIMKSSNK